MAAFVLVSPVLAAPTKSSGSWYNRYSPDGLVLDYPTLDSHLLGMLAGDAASPRKAAAKIASSSSKLSKSTKKKKKGKHAPPDHGDVVLGAPENGGMDPEYRVLYEFDDSKPVEADLAGGTSNNTSSEYYLAAGAQLEPPNPGSPEEMLQQRFDGLYRRSDPTRGYVTDEKRYSYTAVNEQALPKPDRWRTGFPDYAIHDRGTLFNPYKQNVLKGDYPIYKDRTFLNVTAENLSVGEVRELPTPVNQSARTPGAYSVFGRPTQSAFKENLILSLNFFVGDTAFEPPVFQFVVTPIVNVVNSFRAGELGVVLPDVRRGLERNRHDLAWEELFAEYRFAIVEPYFDFVSVRAGRQPFVSDFRGFLFKDTNRGVRVFGNAGGNRTSFNLAYFDMLEKDTNSELNTDDSRGQKVYVANMYRQDFLIPGYTLELVYARNNDYSSFRYDANGVLVRPALIGSITPHELNVNYYGILGDGHLGRFNVTNAYYHAAGNDTFNQIAGRQTKVDADMAAIEVSYDKDWKRYKASFFYQSGDRDPTDGKATGFDTIFDDVNFAGGPFSYWNRQGIRLQGVGLTQRNSLVADLRSSKTQGQANYVNPGLFLYNLGLDLDISPKLKTVFNLNYIQFHQTASLRLFLFEQGIPNDVGWDYSVGTTYRPDLNENLVFLVGAAGFHPEKSFEKIFDRREDLYQVFMEAKLVY